MAAPVSPKAAAAAVKAPVADQSTKPGSPAPEAKKVKVDKVYYPGLKPEKGEDGKIKPTAKLEDWPTDFDGKTMRPLRRNDFTSEGPFLIKKAEAFEARAKQLRNEAEEAKKLGNQADRQKAKKLRDMLGKIADLTKHLKAQGLNVDDMIASMSTAETAAK